MQNSPYNLVLLVATPDEKGVFHFPVVPPVFGLPVDVSDPNTENQVIAQALSALFGTNLDGHFRVDGSFLDLDPIPGLSLNLKIVFLNQAKGLTQNEGIVWKTLPELIRALPKERGDHRSRDRLVYLRAFQVLMGSHLETTEAITLDELRRSVKKKTDH